MQYAYMLTLGAIVRAGLTSKPFETLREQSERANPSALLQQQQQPTTASTRNTQRATHDTRHTTHETNTNDDDDDGRCSYLRSNLL